MKTEKKHHLAALQLAIMEILWDREECTVHEVKEALLPERDLAYTTVATMLSKMEKNGQVSHRSERRVHVYRAEVARENVQRTMVTDLSRRLFQGNLTELVRHLLDDEAVSPDELESLRKLIRQKEREARDDA